MTHPEGAINTEQIQNEEVVKNRISGFGIKVGLGGEFLTTETIPEPKVQTALTEFFAKKGENVDPTPLSKVSTEEREKATDYEPWRSWMDNWITTAGKDTTNASNAKIAGMEALGITDIKGFATASQAEKDQQIKTLYERFFQGSTKVKELADALTQSARSTDNTVSMRVLNERLQAIDSFLSSCGADAKEAITQHILMQGVAEANQATQAVFLKNAPRNINQPLKDNQPEILTDLQGKYNELHPAPDQQPAQTSPEVKPSPVETAKTQERLNRLLKKENSVVTLNDKPGVVSLAEMQNLLGQNANIQFETPSGRRLALSPADLCFKQGEIKGTLQKIKDETNDQGDEPNDMHRQRVLLFSWRERENDYSILTESYSSLAFLNVQEPNGQIYTLLAHVDPRLDTDKNHFTLSNVDETVRALSADRNSGSQRLIEVLKEKYGRWGFSEKIDFRRDDALSTTPTIGKFDPIELKPNTAQARGIAEAKVLEPARQDNPPIVQPARQAREEDEVTSAKEKRIYTVKAGKLMKELEAQGITDDEELKAIILSDIDDILYTIAFPNGVPEKNRSMDIRDVLKNLNKRGMGWDELEKSLFRDAGLDEVILQVLQRNPNPNIDRDVEEAIKKYQEIISKNSASYEGNRFRSPDAPVTAKAFANELYLAMTEVPRSWYDQEQQNKAQSAEAQAEKVSIGKIGVAERTRPPKSHEVNKIIVSEDNKIVDPAHGLVAVLDGVGGLEAGEYASSFAAQSIGESDLASLPDTTPIERVEQVMEKVLLKTHQEVCAQENRITAKVKELKGRAEYKDLSEEEIRTRFPGLEISQMATVATVAKVLEGGVTVIGSVGDTRAYVLRSSKQVDALEALTVDNGVSDPAKKEQRLAKQKKLSNAEKETDLDKWELGSFERRAGIEEALGFRDHGQPKDIYISIERTKLEKGDVLLLTTDGIHDNLTDKEIEAILKKHLQEHPNDAKGAADKLASEAEKRSQDKQHMRHKEDDMIAIVVPMTG